MKAVIYIYTPHSSDMQNREQVRRYLSRTGQAALQFVAQDGSELAYSTSVPHFGSMVKLLSAVSKNEVDLTEKKYQQVPLGKFGDGKKTDDRRCLRILIEDVNPQYDPRRFAAYLPENSSLDDHFGQRTIGSVEVVDADPDYKYKKTYFDSDLDLGDILC